MGRNVTVLLIGYERFLDEASRVPTCKLTLQAMADLSFALFIQML